MAIPLFVGSFIAQRGIVYNGFVPFGNAFRVMNKVKISINKSPMVSVSVNEDIYAWSAFTYEFEENADIMLTRLAQSNLSIIYNSQCPADVPLVKNVQSEIICQVTAEEDINEGSASCIATVNYKQGETLTLEAFKDGVSLGTQVKEWLSNTTASIGFQININTIWSAGQVLSFKLTADKDDATVLGSINPSQAQLERIT